jgi:hypothetical protein
MPHDSENRDHDQVSTGRFRAARNGDPGWQWAAERTEVRALNKTVADLLRRQRELLRRVA